MEYRINRRTGDKIGVIGMGTAYIPEADEKEFAATLEYVFEQGVNYYDLATADGCSFPALGSAFAGVRDKVFYQIHFGADYSRGEYGWTTKADEIRRSVEWQLKNLKTDYIDYAFIHCIDELSDWGKYRTGGALDYLLEMKKAGVARHIGLSSHDPATAQAVLDTGLVDMLMFSINPGYDYSHGDYANGSAEERMRLYRRCERDGIGISVMKAFSGGQLLNEKTSPFGKALAPWQCIRYALDKPGVLTVLPGIRNREDARGLLGYFGAAEEEKDYSVISSLTPADAAGKCVYCNHCQPCPAGIDVGAVNKYYDLARIGDELAADHYKNLSKTASDCIGCGHCNRRCPFHADQVGRMKEIAAYFGK